MAVAGDLSLKLERLIRKTHQKKNLNVVLIRFFTFAENFVLLKKKVIINFQRADCLKLLPVIMSDAVINTEQIHLLSLEKLKERKRKS